MKRIVILLAMGSVVILLWTGCQTAEGFGEDVENAGETIEEAVD